MSAPPSPARRLLRKFTPPGDLQEVEGDLTEGFHRWIEARGLPYARRRYWREVFLLMGWRIAGTLRRVMEGRENTGPGAPPPPLNKPESGSVADLVNDIRYAFRRIIRTPVMSAVAILLLAVGIGGNATVYTVFDKLLLEPPPLIQDPDEMVGLDWVMARSSGVDFGYYDYEFYREQGNAFQDVLAYGGFPGARGRRTDDGGGELVVGRGEGAAQAGAWVVSGNYFQVLGAPMSQGAGFGPQVLNGARGIPEVVLSHGYWTRAFGRDRTVLDRPVYLNGIPFQVVGVTHPDFRGINPGEPVPDLFIPILSAEALIPDFPDQLRRFHDDGSPSASRFLRLVARLRPGLTLATARAETEVLNRRWAEAFASWSQSVYGESYSVRLRQEFDMAPWEVSLLRKQLYFLWFVVGAVFLIGCANLAILLLASAAGREREMGIRASVGAGRKRLLIQLITESLVLSAMGGLVGLALAFASSGLVTASVSMEVQGHFVPDTNVIAFTLLLSTLSAVVFGTAPAWSLSRVDVATLIQRPGQARNRARFRGGLVVVQTALSLILLIGGGLLLRSVQAVRQVDLGFEVENRVFLSLLLDNLGYSEEEGEAFVPAALSRLGQVPGVRAVSVCNRIPFLGNNTWTFTAPGTAYAEEGLRMNFNLAGPGYFEAMGIPLVSGRAFSVDDLPSGQRVAVVNEVLAERFWPGDSPLGRTIDFAEGPVEVVGVVEASVYNRVTDAPRPFLYLPSLQWYQGRQNFIIATESAPGPMVPRLSEALRELDPKVTASALLASELVKSQTTSLRIWSVLIGAFAGTALFLALVGLYGVQSFLVDRRRHEIGLRMALGARSNEVVFSVVRSGLIMGGLGVVLGISGALALSNLLRGAFFGVTPDDPLVYSVVSALLLAACLMASLIPALRASRVNPVDALNTE